MENISEKVIFELEIILVKGKIHEQNNLLLLIKSDKDKTHECDMHEGDIVILSLSHLGVTRARMNLMSKVLRFLLFAFQSFCVEYYLPEMVGRKFDGLNNKRTGLENILPSTKSFPESF